MRIKPMPAAKGARAAYEMLNGLATEIKDYGEVKLDNGAILTIGAGHTGDMYDVDIAHYVVNDSVVVIWGVNDDTAEKAAAMARYLNDRTRVMWTTQPPPDEERFRRTKPVDLRDLADERRLRGRYWVREGGATTIVARVAENSPGRLRGLVAPPLELEPDGTDLDPGLIDDLRKHGFETDRKYVIVNYRESGHSGKGTAPALDTGQDGFLQLMSIVHDLGLVPVPMGEFDPFPRLEAAKSPIPRGPELLNYWTWPSVQNLGRRGEARLLRVLAEQFPVLAAVGMRSGVTDLLAYVGLRTLSIDNHPLRGAVAKGWQRPLKRERVMPNYRVVSLREARHRELEKQDAWLGPFGDKDLQALGKAMKQLLGDNPNWQADQHPRATDEAATVAASVLGRVRQTIARLQEAQKEPIPTEKEPPSGSKRKLSALEEIKAMNEEQKARGVAPSQMAQYERDLRQLREDTDLLDEWLRDDFVPGSAERDKALRDLDDAHRALKNAGY